MRNIDEALHSIDRAQERIMSLRRINYQRFSETNDIDYGVNIDTDYARDYLLLATENLLIQKKVNQNAALNCIINAKLHIKTISNRSDLDFEFVWDADDAIDFLYCAEKALLKALKPSRTWRKRHDNIQRRTYS
jgi:hypothetical protein